MTSWEPAVPALSYDADVTDGRSTSSRPSSVKRIIRRMGLATERGHTPSFAHAPYASSSSGSLAKSCASMTAPTRSEEQHDEEPSSTSASSRRRARAGKVESEQRDVADMLEDENLAWGKPPSRFHWRKDARSTQTDDL
ncbi:hypothetical protein C8Q70DRAFT_1051068 [Cubamyces menziesii]|nr:hypothetical protein C8Q70DRAFT_1051068 [Cubamyces menziesii]